MKRMAVETQEGKKVALENGVVVISKFTLKKYLSAMRKK